MANPNDFIKEIAPFVQKYAPKYGIKVVSPIIAQACLQSAYGTSKKAKFHNYFGLKYRANRVTVNNGYFEDGGSEQNSDGTYRPLPSSTAWYAFDNMEKGVQGYFQFINISNYANLKTTSDPLTYLRYIKADNYATSLNYVDNVYKIITQYNLTQYDFKEKEQTKISNNINIIKRFNTTNTTVRNDRDIKWIVLHYTAGTNSNPGCASNVANWFANPAAQASADFIVDDGQIVQYNPDLKNRYCWSVGGGKTGGKNTSLAGIYHGQCTNSNSISIEMCSRKTNISTLKATDPDWYLTEATVNNAVKLTQYLMNLYNIDIKHVIMHHMVTGKLCPSPWTLNENRLADWYKFLSKVQNKNVTQEQIKIEPVSPIPAAAPQPKITNFPYLVEILVSNLRIRSGPGTQYTIQGFVNKGIKYTIVEEKNGFGRLKSGAGWISLNPNYAKKL